RHGPAKAPRGARRASAGPRVEEIFAVLRKRIEDPGLLEQLSAGVVLTGGAVLLDGMTEFAEEILGLPVRLGLPVGVRGITQLVAGPQYATGVGLVQYGANALSQARERAVSSAEAMGRADLRQPTPAPRSDRTKEPEEALPDPERRGRFWSWLRAAF